MCVWKLTDWSQVTYGCVSNLTIINSDNGLTPGRQQAIIWINAGWNIINWTLGIKLQWNLNRSLCTFLPVNAYENVVGKMGAILPRPLCVSHLTLTSYLSGPKILQDPHVSRYRYKSFSLQWRHNEHDGISNHRRLDYLLNRLFGRRSKKTSKLRVSGLCEGNSPVPGEFPTQRASDTENVSIW